MACPASFGARFAARFHDQSLVDRYHLRPPYPPEIVTLLSELIVDEPRTVLDLGCGTGAIARPLADAVQRVDAVDWSEPMVARARTLPGGDSPKIRWLHGRAEEVETQPPYALITAGESLHWMEWDVLLPRLAGMITSHGVLAIAWVEEAPAPWSDDAHAIMQRFTTNPTYVPFDWRDELAQRKLFEPLGERLATPATIRQPVADYIAAQHARSAFSLDAMTAAQVSEFDTAMEALLTPFAPDGALTLRVGGGIAWGRPRCGAQPGDASRGVS